MAFPLRDASKLARELMTRPFRDHVFLTRVIIGRELAEQRPIKSRSEPAILREPGQSVILATGHFAREAVLYPYLPSVAPKRLAAVLAGLDQRSLDPRALRLRIQFGAMIKVIKVVRKGDVEIVQVGQPGVISRLVKHLREPDTVTILATDSVSAKGREKGFARPFAGHSNVGFALGTARLARLSQRPILVCVPFVDEDGAIVLEWSEPIPPPNRDDDGADGRITGAIIDILERSVGARPEQYVLSIGDERGWNETTQCWVEPPAGSKASAEDSDPTRGEARPARAEPAAPSAR